MIKIIGIILIFFISTGLFYRASGTLNPGKMNIISCIYYIFMLQTFAGVLLVNCGFDQHYTLNYLLDREKSIEATTQMVCMTAVLLPVIILLVQRILKFDVKTSFSEFLNKKIEVIEKSERIFFGLFCVAMIVAAGILVGVLAKIGYVPFFRLFVSPEGFDMAVARGQIASVYFLNRHLSNIVIAIMIPILSYLSFSYAVMTKKKIWHILSFVTFLLSVITKTYKFEKSPLAFHLLIYVLIFMYAVGGIKVLHMLGIIAVLGVVIVTAYLLSGFSGNIVDLYNGPVGRTLFTEVGTLAYCFDLFPSVFGFLGGRSFSPTILKLLGMDPALHLRSAKLVMAFYGSEKVYDGSAGVMNTLFIGEAYANWSYIGIVVAVLWVALLVAVLSTMILKMKKTPASITLLAVLTVRIGMMLEGGFCDFVYSLDLILTVAVYLGVYVIFETDGAFIRKDKRC